LVEINFLILSAIALMKKYLIWVLYFSFTKVAI